MDVLNHMIHLQGDGAPVTTTPAGRRLNRLAMLCKLVEGLVQVNGEFDTDVEQVLAERLLEHPPERIDAVNTPAISGERTGGSGTAGCLAALTILGYPDQDRLPRCGVGPDCPPVAAARGRLEKTIAVGDSSPQPRPHARNAVRRHVRGRRRQVFSVNYFGVSCCLI